MGSRTARFVAMLYDIAVEAKEDHIAVILCEDVITPFSDVTSLLFE